MPPMKRRPPGAKASTRIPILSLSSGVSTQAPSKRLPLEAEVMDNALLSLERSFEKRPGFEILPQITFTGNNSTADSNRLDLFRCVENLAQDANKDFWWYWFTINENNRFLIGIDYKASVANSVLFYVFKINANNWEDITPTTATNEQGTAIVSTSTRAYITYGSSNSYKARDVLKATTVGSSIIVLNTLVKAGFTSSDNGFLFKLDGSEDSSLPDTKGKKVTYYTSSRVSGTTGSLETNASSSTTNISITGNAVPDPFTCATVIPDTSVLNQTVLFYNSSASNSSTNSKYLTGTVTAIFNSDANTLKFADTPQNFKQTTSTSITGNALLNSSLQLTTSATIPSQVAVNQNVLVWVDADNYFTGTITGASGTALTVKVNFVSATLKAKTTADTTAKNIGYECMTVDVNYISPTLAADTAANTSWAILWGVFVPVEDFIYKDSTQPWLGQSFADFSEIRFPPEATEVYANNGNFVGAYTVDDSAKTMLDALYDSDHPLESQSALSGRGKIYYTAGPYLSQTSGYYRIVNFPESISYKDGSTRINGKGRPYTQKVRSPDLYSVIDERRMPQKLTFNEAPTGINSDWVFAPIAWEPKTTGNRYSNPGPSVFLSSDKKTARQVRINAISTFRDRLYFAAEDVIFSTQLGIYEDLFLADPSNIVSSDPIDIRASSKTYAEISSITPFSDFLFVNTKGDIQFELRGSENQITPLTAQIAPTSFYATAKLTEPILMGSLIYFFDKRRLYMYMTQQGSSLSTAQEISSHCGDYLPTNYRATCSCPAQNTIVTVDDDNPNYLYLYTNRFSGDKVLQNAFYRYILETGNEIESSQVYDNYLHVVIKKKSQDGSKYEYYIQRTYLQKQDKGIPKLDNYSLVNLYVNSNCSYNTSTNETRFNIVFPYSFDPSKVLLITDPSDSRWGERKYTVIKPDYVANANGIGYIFTVNGNYAVNQARLYIGTKFTMNVELSTQFVRDQNNNVIDGVLNLKTLALRHADTGNYDIIATRRGKSVIQSKFSALVTNNNLDTLSIENTEKSGEFVAKVFGFSDTTRIQIVSDYPTPVNIINMELKGKFTQTYTSLNT